jgi:hypothetical protein
MADLIPVTFNEGEPLDVTKLNNLRLNITNTYETAASLQNATLDGKTVPMIDFGSVDVVVNKVGSNGPVNLPINSNFSGTPLFIVSIGGGEIGSAIVSARVIGQSGSTPQVLVQSSAALNKTIKVNFIAIQNKTV